MSPTGAARPNPGRRVVVDGSNLATEGRNTPSLAQLDEAVRAFHSERPGDEIIVVVDASFGYRIDESERKVFEEAEEAGEIVSPPAGAIGRGDGFLLRIADRINADVLSNDSFQEFHGEYLWLFEEGRLVGGKPVPGVGWIFTPRTPVRGPKSRMATRDSDRARKRAATPAARPEPTSAAIAEATAEAIAPDAPTAAKRGSRRRSRSGADGPAPEAINEPLPFITFIADHPLGTEVEGTVEGFTSHGAFVTAGGARCYAPVSGLGDPAPRSAKEVLAKGEVRQFVIQALDPPRRGIELALPGLAKVAGAPTEETVEAEIHEVAHPVSAPEPTADADESGPAPTKARSRRGRRGAPAEAEATEAPGEPVAEPGPAPGRPRRGAKATTAPVEASAGRGRGRGRKAAASPAGPAPAVVAVVEVAPEPDSGQARPRRSSVRRAAPAVVEVAPEPAPAPARRSRKKAAVPVAEPPPVAEVAPAAPVVARRSRKKAAALVEAPPPVVEVEAPKTATRSRKKVAAPVEAPAAAVEVEVPKKATRSRKKAAAPVEAPAAAVKKAAVKKAAVKKAPAKKAPATRAKKAAPSAE